MNFYKNLYVSQIDHAEEPPKLKISRLMPSSGQNGNRDFGHFGRPNCGKRFPQR